MSEYQYYEFAAIDGPISDEGLRYARGCSTRAKVSRVRWQNTYTFGDFHGSVETLLKYYDAHCYIANWGTVRLALAFPEKAIMAEALQPYVRENDGYGETLMFQKIGNRCIVWWERNEEDGGDWMEEDEGVIDQLAGVREELMRGDNRGLFLGWLAGFDPEEHPDDENGSDVMPVIPPGLDNLSPALEALIEYFPVDPDALAVAAESSQARSADRIPITAVLEKLSQSEMRALLARVADGRGSSVTAELNRLTYSPAQVPVTQAMRCCDFAAKIIAARESRHQSEAASTAAKRQHEAELRRQHLASVLQRAGNLWSRIDSLMDQRVSSAYDQVAAQLQELREAYAQAGAIDTFQNQLIQFRHRYSNRSAMLRRVSNL